MSDPLLWNLATYAFVKFKKSMRSLTTGIGFCKTKFHLSRGEHMVVSSADYLSNFVMLSGFCIYVLAPSATLDRHLKTCAGIGGIVGTGLGSLAAPMVISASEIEGVMITTSGIMALQSNFDKFNQGQIHHFIEGSRWSNHHWELLSPTKQWSEIREYAFKAFQMGIEQVYKEDKNGITYCRNAIINGYRVTVTYRIINGVIKISEGWVN